MSSEPKDYQSSPDLYCNESSEEIDLFQDYANLDYDHIFYSNSNSIPFEEISIINAFDSEVDQVFDSNLIRRLNNDPALFAARLEAVHWMLKVGLSDLSLFKIIFTNNSKLGDFFFFFVIAIF